VLDGITGSMQQVTSLKGQWVDPHDPRARTISEFTTSIAALRWMVSKLGSEGDNSSGRGHAAQIATQVQPPLMHVLSTVTTLLEALARAHETTPTPTGALVQRNMLWQSQLVSSVKEVVEAATSVFESYSEFLQGTTGMRLETSSRALARATAAMVVVFYVGRREEDGEQTITTLPSLALPAAKALMPALTQLATAFHACASFSTDDEPRPIPEGKLLSGDVEHEGSGDLELARRTLTRLRDTAKAPRH
jgi:hypothetical protein